MWKNDSDSIIRKYLSTAALSFSFLLILMGCGKKELPSPSYKEKSTSPKMTFAEIERLESSVGKKYAQNPNDKDIGLQFSALLQMRGKMDQSLAVMRRLAIAHPKDRSILAAYGKALAAAGHLHLALDTIRRAQTPEYPDWKLFSAEASILDQLNQPDDARKLYKKALDLKPNHPSIMSNIGISYLLTGNVETAVTYLRKASQHPHADSRVRQNLALALGLQGKFKEASGIISKELPQDYVKSNIHSLRQMLTQQNAWSQIEEEARK